jgi:hypothetical protein
MSIESKLRFPFVLFCGVAMFALCGATAHALPVVFTIDPARSSIRVNTDPTVNTSNPTGDVTKLLSTAVTEQVPGSGTDTYSGTIAADETGGVLTFSGGSSVVAALNTAGSPPYTPTTPAGVDNYGMKTVSATGTTGGVVFAALRNTAFDITSGTVSDLTVPSGVNLQIPNGAFGAVTLFGALSTAGAGADSTGVAASLTTSGGIETLILPITRITGTSAHFVLIGQLVATRQVPEPSTFVLAGVSAAGLAVVCLKKRLK